MSVHLTGPTISLETAISGTESWRQFYEFCTHVDNSQIFRGFFIPVDDLRRLLDEAGDKIDGVRAYFALDKPFSPLTPVADNDIHIYLVPVKDNIDIVEDREGESNVCDFTTPCPKICDTSSLLYDVFTKK